MLAAALPGLSAGIYASRAGLKAIITEMSALGGQIAISSILENYPGISSISGLEFGEMLAHHAEAAGCSLIRDEVTKVWRTDDGVFHTVVGGAEHTSKVLIYAAGSQPRLAGFENEERFTGRGVSYCATCDGMLFRNKPVYVVGSGQSACEEAEYLTRMSSSVTMLVRGDILKGTLSSRQALESNPKVEIRYNTRILGLSGDMFPESITTENLETGERIDGGTGRPCLRGLCLCRISTALPARSRPRRHREQRHRHRLQHAHQNPGPFCRRRC